MREPNPHRRIGLILRLGVLLALTPGWLGGLALPSRFQPAIPAAGAAFERADDDTTVDILPTWWVAPTRWAESSAAWSQGEGGAVASADPGAGQENGHLQGGSTIYVDANAAGADDGTSWADAYPDLQSALGAATSGGEIWVAEGTYTPGTARTATFQLKSGVGVYGGFAGTETARSQRDWAAHPTVLSGEIGAAGNGDNAYHVVTGSSTGASAVLDGFTITAGNANGSVPNNLGGGLSNRYGSPTLANLTFVDNAAGSGGGMSNWVSSPKLTNVIFNGNSASDDGGGMYDNSSNPTLTNVIFSGNSASDGGGGMYNVDSSPRLANVTFSGNSAVRGGGMSNWVNSKPTLTNCILWGNTAPSGPQIGNSSSTPAVTYSDVQDGYPGTGNIDADPLFVDAHGADDVAGTPDDNLRLHANSPAVDAGDNSAVPAGITTDLDGTPRYTDMLSVPDTGDGSPPIVDMGAYETPRLRYVSPTGIGNCSSWANACTLQSALGDADFGDEIWVAEGTYTPGTARTATFQLKSSVGVYGGFAGTETARNQRDWAAHPTVLSGDIGTPGDNSDNTYHVVTGSSTGASAVLDGFTISGGNADGPNPHDDGGGMYNSSGSPALTNVTFDGNSAVWGGGMSNWYDSKPTLTNVTFSGNSASVGGGMFNNLSDPKLVNVTFSGNSATNRGGGMCNEANSPTLVNVTFSGNFAYDGGGMDTWEGSPTLTNVTFSGNSASGNGGGIRNYNSSPTLANCILWGNTAPQGAQIYNSSSTPTIKYSDIQGGYAGTGNIDADPLFVDAHGADDVAGTPDDNLRLHANSPAVDAGDNSAVPAGITTDLDGNPRFSGQAVDMGAYELAPHTSRDTAVPVDPGIPLTDIITTTDEGAWYSVVVTNPGSTLTVTLSGLSDVHDLFLFGPAMDEATSQLRDIAMIKDSAMIQASGFSGNPGDLLDTWTDARGKRNVCRTENIGLLGNTGQLGGIGSLLCISARDSISEMVALDVHELYGPFYVAVSGHTPEATGQPYTLTAQIEPPAGEPCLPLTHTIATTFMNLVTGTTFPSKTLILFNRTRFNQVFTATDTITSSQLVARLDQLKDQVDGEIIDLDEYPEINKAYEIWERYPTCPQAANFVATQIKFLLYNLVPIYPDLEYLVIVGGDPVIPYRRIRDEAVFANERKYAKLAHAPVISQSLASRYFLSDDYYATVGSVSLQGQEELELLLPIPWKGRELYLPHVAIGRLVEAPSEIVTAIDAFLDHPVISPTDALVTGYDFLTDQAHAITQTLSSQGITSTTLETLISENWTADDLRKQLISATATFTAARGLNSLNAHSSHFALAPALTTSVPISASEITDALEYTGTLAFSVGCHSGLNVPDADCDSSEAATDWPQAFMRQGASFIGNTGFGYGDADQVAYSERLMVNFVEELNYVVDGLPTVGGALLRAKHRYYSSAAAGAFSNYDEKVMGQATLYGLPMLAVQMPVTTATPPGGAVATDTVTLTLNLNYRPVAVTSATTGTYYTIWNQPGADVQALGARPIEPRLSLNVHLTDTIAHGVLMLGGTFTDVAGFDPLISRVVISDSISGASAGEPTYDEDHWYPAQIATINRFLGSDGQSRDRLVVLPGQFRPIAASTPTTGTQRLYSNLALQIYRAPLADTDFIAPSIWQVRAISSPHALLFSVQVEDDSGSVERTVVLYRQEDEYEWSRVELDYDPATGWAIGSTSAVSRPIYYFAQAVDPSGNVALALDHGNPFKRVERAALAYLPLAFKDYLLAPDLLVERITPVGNNVQVVVRNRGNAPATGDFWVDLYVDPDPVPSAVNQIWNDLADEGVVWDVTADIRPGEALTLTVGDAYTVREYSDLSSPLEAETWIYVQVDSANTLTDFGGVLEDHEITGGPYNNIAGVRLSAPGDVGPLAGDRPAPPAGRLPPRP